MADNKSGSNHLTSLFERIFKRFEFDTQSEGDIIRFESDILRGDITLNKPFTITWKTKRGFVISDHPISNGNSSAQFNKVGDLLDFMTRNILHK
jgi:hypothetical protein